MSFTLRFQDPSSNAATFFELLIESAQGKSRGAGVFAFASAHGVRLLLTDSDFKTFLQCSEFDLIVGVDAVTVPETLELLKDAEEEYPSFRAHAFFHQRSGTLFHPKLCWFIDDAVGRLLVGSGNLTRGGLLKNWEAFGDANIRGGEIRDLIRSWSNWINSNNHLLRAVNDFEVIERAQRNVGDFRRRHEEDEVEDADISSEPAEAEVLIAEIPRASTRWNQANFDLATFRGFFELEPETFQRVVLLPVSPDGSVGDPEIRQSVSVISQNYRIELGEASGLDYPDEGRPIGVFLRIGTRRFRYRLMMPDQVDYLAVSNLLDTLWSSRTGRTSRIGSMKRVRLSISEFRRAIRSRVL